MIMADIYDLLNDVFFEVIRFVLIGALMVLAISLGVKLRKHHDNKKKNEMESSITDEKSDTTDASI